MFNHEIGYFYSCIVAWMFLNQPAYINSLFIQIIEQLKIMEISHMTATCEILLQYEI